MNNVQNQNDKVLGEIRTGSNSEYVKTTFRSLSNPPPFCKFLKNFSPFLCHSVTWDRGYYK